jgi:hypothetical protein
MGLWSRDSLSSLAFLCCTALATADSLAVMAVLDSDGHGILGELVQLHRVTFAIPGIVLTVMLTGVMAFCFVAQASKST